MLIFKISTFNTSPGSAPSTNKGPVAGLILSQPTELNSWSSVWMRLLKQSQVSKIIVEPLLISCTGGLDDENFKITCSFGILTGKLVDIFIPPDFKLLQIFRYLGMHYGWLQYSPCPFIYCIKILSIYTIDILFNYLEICFTLCTILNILLFLANSFFFTIP